MWVSFLLPSLFFLPSCLSEPENAYIICFYHFLFSVFPFESGVGPLCLITFCHTFFLLHLNSFPSIRFVFRVFLVNLPMQAKLLMASLKGRQLGTRLELLMPTLWAGGFALLLQSHSIRGTPLLHVRVGWREKHLLPGVAVWYPGGRWAGLSVHPADGSGFCSLRLPILLPLPTWHFQAISPRFFKAYSAFSRAVSHLSILHAVTLSILHLASLHPFAALHRPGASLMAQW